MATSENFIAYVCEQVRGTGAVRYRKMFGEYMVYVDDKPVLLVCDNCVYVKELPCTAEIMPGAERGFPYDGAKEHYILDIDNADLCASVVRALAEVTAVPVKRKKASK